MRNNMFIIEAWPSEPVLVYSGEDGSPPAVVFLFSVS